MNDNTRKVYVILHETVTASWLKDFGSLGSLAILAYVNHTYCGGVAIYDVLATILFTGWTLSKVAQRSGYVLSMTVDELREWSNRETEPAP